MDETASQQPLPNDTHNRENGAQKKLLDDLSRAGSATSDEDRTLGEWSPLPNRVWGAVVVYLVCYLYMIMEGYYLANGLAMLVGFLLFYPHLARMPGYDWLRGLSYRRQMALLFLFALILRFGLLGQSQVITMDIEYYVNRSEALVIDGKKPYVERADINKPPLFALYIWLIGTATEWINSHLLGGSEVFLNYYVAFRIVSSIADALVVAVIFHVARARFPLGTDGGEVKDRALNAALGYALFPIAIESSGLSGHYDPLVILTTLGALHLIWPKAQDNGRVTKSNLTPEVNDEKVSRFPAWSPYLLAGLLLGLGIALKFYPVVMAPFLLFAIPSWRERIMYILGLPLATLASFGILEWRYPGATRVYYEYQGGDWMEIWLKSWARAIQELSGTTRFLGVTWSDIFLLLFGLMGLVYLTGWVLARWFGPHRSENGSRTRAGLEEGPGFTPGKGGTRDLGQEGPATEVQTDKMPRFLVKGELWVQNHWIKAVERWPQVGHESSWTLVCFQFMAGAFLLYYLFQIASGFYIFEEQLWTSPPPLFALLWLLLGGALLYRYMPDFIRSWTPEELDLRTQEPLLLMLAFGVMILLFGSPDYPTWYICWYAPFVFMAPTFKSRYLMLVLMVWNTPGEGLSVLPDLVTGQGVT